MADSIGNGLKVPDVDRLEALSARVGAVLAEAGAIAVEDLAIGGAEVMAVLGVPPGRRVGEALEALLEAVLEDPARNTPEGLQALLEGMREGERRP